MKDLDGDKTMKDDLYNQLLAEIEALTEAQVDELIESLHLCKDTNAVTRLITARLAEQHGCPYCHSTNVVKNGKARGTQRFMCRPCGKSFSPLTGTPLHRLHNKEKLLDNAACMVDGLSIRKTAARLGFTVDKTFRWRHKFLGFIRLQQPAGMTGIVEADETKFPLSFKGQRKGLPRAAKKRSGKLKDGEGGEQVTIIVALQRGSRKVFDHVLPDGTAKSMTEALRPVLGPGTVLSTDGNAAYWTVAKELKVQSGHFVSSYHGKGGKGAWHVQSVNRYDSSLKSWMARFHGVATKYLANYLGWRRLLDRFQDSLTPQQFLFHVLRTAYSGQPIST